MPKVLKGILVSVVTVVLIFAVLYGFVIAAGISKIGKERKQLQIGINEVYIYHPELAYTLKPDNSVYFNGPGDTSEILRSSDVLGRRVNPRYNSADEHLIFFGGSYTYGQGCHDYGTMPWLLSSMDTTKNIYNYALEGYGTQHMYDQLKGGISSDIREEDGIAIYIYIEHHRMRVCWAPDVSRWGYDFNAYELLPNQELSKRGKFFEVYHPQVYFYKGLVNLNLFNSMLPVMESLRGYKKVQNLNDDDHLLVAKIIAESKEEYLKQFPKGQFLTIIYPGEQTGIGDVFKAFGIDVLDLSAATDLHAIGGIQRDGFHPNKIGNLEVANLINWYLQTTETFPSSESKSSLSTDHPIN